MDDYIGSQINLNNKKFSALTKVVSRQLDPYGTIIRTKNDILYLDSQIYDVKFEDGHYKKYAAKILTRDLTASYNKDGFDTGFISEISGHHKHSTNTLCSQDYFLFKNGNRCMVITIIS